MYFLSLSIFFYLDVIVSKNNHVDEETFSRFFVNGVALFGGLNDAVYLVVEIPQNLELVSFSDLCLAALPFFIVKSIFFT